MAGRNRKNLRYTDDITLMVNRKEELKSLLMRVNGEHEKGGLKLKINGEIVEAVIDFIFLGSKSLQVVIEAMKLKDTCSLEGKL